jgi:hypothetical protein
LELNAFSTILDYQATIANDQAIYALMARCIYQGSCKANDKSRKTPERKNEMDIKRNGTQAALKGLADWFTETVRIDPLFLQTDDPASASASSASAASVTWL